MLYYSALQPQQDWQDPSVAGQRHRISTLLSAVTMNHYRNTGGCFDALEQEGIILGCGGFEAALLQSDPLGPMESNPDWARQMVEKLKEHLPFPLWYCFSVNGRLYVLLCFPRLQEHDEKCRTIQEKIFTSFQKIKAELLPRYPKLRILLSDLQYGTSGVFHCFNNLYHAMEYYDFRTAGDPLIQLDSEAQLHDAFIADLSAYRQFSVSIAEQLVRENCSVSETAHRVMNAILQNSVPSMESIHHHIQIFMLTFTDYLGSSGLVDASYLRRHHIVYRAMAFETEAQLRALMESLLEELRKQHRMLLALGRQKRTQSIREYAEQHITEPDLTVTRISQVFGVSAAQLAKQFRYYYGVSLHRFLQQSRFYLAQSLIEAHPAWSMQQVAEAAGYTDLSTMYRAFRQFGDITPGALKASVRHRT